MERASEEPSLNSPLSCEDVRPLLPAVAIGALDRTDAVGVAQHLLVCPACRQELDRYGDTADYVGFAVPQITPHPSLRPRILAALSTNGYRRFTPRWRLAASIAAALIVMLLAANLALQLHLIDSDSQSTASPRRTASATAPQLVWFDLTASGPNAGSASGILCAQRDGNLAWLIVQDLPQLPPGKIYQAWLSNDGQRVSAGTFSVDDRGRGFLTIRLAHPIDSYALLGVTDEPDGGSPAPSGERFLSVSL